MAGSNRGDGGEIQYQHARFAVVGGRIERLDKRSFSEHGGNLFCGQVERSAEAVPYTRKHRAVHRDDTGGRMRSRQDLRIVAVLIKGDGTEIGFDFHIGVVEGKGVRVPVAGEAVTVFTVRADEGRIGIAVDTKQNRASSRAINHTLVHEAATVVQGDSSHIINSRNTVGLCIHMIRAHTDGTGVQGTSVESVFGSYSILAVGYMVIVCTGYRDISSGDITTDQQIIIVRSASRFRMESRRRKDAVGQVHLGIWSFSCPSNHAATLVSSVRILDGSRENAARQADACIGPDRSYKCAAIHIPIA